VTGWSGHAEDDRHVAGNEMRDTCSPFPNEGSRWRCDDKEVEPAIFRVGFVGLKTDQHTALVGTPVIAEESQMTPCAEILLADCRAGFVDRTSLLAEMGALHARELLQFVRIDREGNAADPALAAFPSVHQLQRNGPCKSFAMKGLVQPSLYTTELRAAVFRTTRLRRQTKARISPRMRSFPKPTSKTKTPNFGARGARVR